MRFLRRDLPTTLVAIFTLACGTAASIVVFSIVFGVLLRPLPYGEPERLVQITTQRPSGDGGLSLPEVDDWRARAALTTDVAAIAHETLTLSAAAAPPAPVAGAMVSPGWFRLLEITPRLGRWFDEARPDAMEVVVAERFWRVAMDADPAVIGRAVRINARPFTVIGVASGAAEVGVDAVDLWVTIDASRAWAPPQWSMRGYRAFSVFGRLAPEATLAAARAEAREIGRGWSTTYPRFSADVSLDIAALFTRITAPARPVLLMLVVSAIGVLVIACGNLAVLILARNVTRAGEWQLRVALGASRWSLLRQALGEAMALAWSGTLAGMLIAAATMRVLPSLVPSDLPRVGDIRLDWASLAFALVVATAVGVAAGLTGAGHVKRVATERAFGDRRVHGDRRTRIWHRRLIVGQLALAFALVLTSALLTRALDRLLRAPIGASHVNAIAMALTGVSPPLLDRVLPEIRRLPGVVAAGVTSSLPPHQSQMRTTITATGPRSGASVDAAVDIVGASPGALEALGVRVLSGRAFVDSDLVSGRRSIVISARAAARLFEGVDPIGRGLAFGPQQPGVAPPAIVGVVDDVRYQGLAAPADGAIYLPYSMRSFSTTHLVVQADGVDGVGLVSSIRSTVGRLDADRALGDVQSIADAVRADARPARVRTQAVTLLGIVALAVCGLGLYAITAHAVGTRTGEIGLRLALGATANQIRGAVLADSLRVVAGGLIAGVIPAFAAVKVASRFLGDIGGFDLPAIAAAVLVLTTAGVLASWVPAVRASRLSPVEALRAE